MKLFTRVKLAVILSALTVMLAGSAWAATYTIGADVKLNSTGTRMELKLTYLKDGQPDPIWNFLTPAQGEGLSKVFALGLYLENVSGGINRYVSDSPLVMDVDSFEAVFQLTPALEDGDYIFRSFSFIHNAETSNWSDAQWEAYFNGLGINMEQVENADFPYKGNDDHLNKVNGGQPVTIKRESSSSTVPGAPTGVTATAGDRQATVRFNAPTNNGGSAITGYTVTANPGNVKATGTATPITVTGLTNGTAYTFTVIATNSVGNGPASSASNSVTPTGGGSSSGCNTGFGVIGLLLAGVAALKYRKK